MPLFLFAHIRPFSLVLISPLSVARYADDAHARARLRSLLPVLARHLGHRSPPIQQDRPHSCDASPSAVWLGRTGKRRHPPAGQEPACALALVNSESLRGTLLPLNALASGCSALMDLLPPPLRLVAAGRCTHICMRCGVTPRVLSVITEIPEVRSGEGRVSGA